MKKLFTIISFSIAIFFIGSCNKNDSPPPSNTDHIIRAAWKFDKATSGGFDVSSFIDNCYKDNTITFTANGNGTMDEGASKCDASDPQTVNFTWNFTNNGSTLNVTGGIIAGQSGSFTVLTLNETAMVLEATINSSTGQIYFKH